MQNNNKYGSEGLVLDIQRMSTEDGPGLRTTVFLKGCPLHCEWCHNPESISPEVEIEYFTDKCIGCSLCIHNCPAEALSMSENGVIRNIEKCRHCLQCSSNCPALAARTKGEKYTPGELVQELVKDRAYFGTTGGVTVSGGEALFQSDFTAEVCRLLKKENIHTAVDSCGLCPFSAFEEVFPYTDLFLHDIKLIDPAEHKIHTGADNKLILNNLKKLAEKINTKEQDGSVKLWIRTPVIPGATDTEQNIAAVAGFIKEHLIETVERWELCAFNNLCAAKYERFGNEWKYKNAPLISADRMEALRQTAVKSGIPSDIVFTTGMTG